MERDINNQEDPGDITDVYFQEESHRLIKTYYFYVNEQRVENPGVDESEEGGVPSVDVVTKTFTDILHLSEDQILTIEQMAKPYKNAEKIRFITTTITDYNPEVEATITYDQLEAMLLNWTDE